MQSGGGLGIKKKKDWGTFLKGNILSEKLPTEQRLRFLL
jgi:hypothetical protein